MSSSDAKGARRPAFASVANLILGLLTLIAGGALLYWPGVQAHWLQSGTGVEAFAASMIVLGLVMAVASFRPALRALNGASLQPSEFKGREHVVPLQELGRAPDRVAFTLIEPAGSQMSLTDAVRRAYSESYGTAAATFANAFGTGPDDIAIMYATFFAEHVPINGCRRPTNHSEQVSLTNPPKEFRVEDGALILKESEGDGVYDDLKIAARDYPVVLSRLCNGPH